MEVDDWQLEQQAEGGFVGRLVLPGGQAPVSLRIDAGRGGPLPAQLDAVRELMDNWTGLQEPLRLALFAYYSAIASDAGDECPQVASQDVVVSFVTIKEVHVPPTAAQGSRLVRVEGECAWAPEDGLEIGVRNGRELLYLGPNDGKGLREPPTPSPSNFADLAIQDAALMGIPISEEEFDRVQAILAAGTYKLPSRQRPWWKFW